MPGKIVDKRDIEFVLWEQLDLEKHLDHEVFKGYGKDEFNMIIEEALKFAEGSVYPANVEGDREGVHLEDGQVKAPPSYKPVYDTMVEGGWMGLASPEEYGGQDLPEVISIVANELLVAGSVAFAIYPGLTRAAGHLMETYCNDEQKQKYLPKMVEGKWQGTMALTEPQAGSALGDLKTSAKKRDDGTWSISGNKIFISGADHDMVENVVHLVLARAEDSPPGIKGVSLFIVPKYKVGEDSSMGEYNNVETPKVEEKMGIHGASTCEVVFGDKGECVGELIGELNQGIKYMFKMMNEARIGTGLQGAASASAAYLHALQYAKERIQGTRIEDMKDVNAPRVEIIKHPDVRRMLLTMKSLVEGMRALIYRGVWYSQLSEMEQDEKKKEEHEDILGLLTPVIKSYCSEQGYIVTNLAMQVYGGYGYIQEYPVEQYVRDCKISSIYEGANGIQALDLVGRKVLNIKKQMKPYNDFMAMLREFVEKNKGHKKHGAAVEKVGKAIETVDEITKLMAAKGMAGDQGFPVMFASPFLEMFGHTLVGWLLAEQLLIADQKLEALFEDKGAKDDEKKSTLVEESDEAAYYSGKVRAATFFIDTFLPHVDAIATTIKSENRDMVEISERAF